MASVYESLNEIVCKYMSSISAKAILNQVLGECGRTPTDVSGRDLSLLSPKLERAVVLFLGPAQRAALRADIDGLNGPSFGGSVNPANSGLRARRLDIVREQDISEARAVARQMCLELSARSFNVQKVATVVSELARNIVNYSTGGYIELTPHTAPPVIHVVSSDRGPGIKNLEEIMSGNYRSKTGLGLGILGTKRLADTFTIETGPRGTRVEAGVRL